MTVENLNIFYGIIHAVHDVSIEIAEGEIVTLLGANGAGKTSTLLGISNIIPKNSGKIQFAGEDISGTQAHRIVGKGLGHVPEGRHVFSELTVMENLEMGAYTQKSGSNINEDIEKVFGLFPRLQERKKQVAGTLSGGEQQMLVMARGLMSRPKLLLLDEPSMGLAPVIVEEVFDTIVRINRQGTSIFLVEQNTEMALSIAHRGYVLETGRVVLSGLSAELAENDRVQEAYLGGHMAKKD